MQVGYFYDAPLPNQLAEPIQFINTCHALARRGVETLIIAPKLRQSAELCLAHYNLQPIPTLIFTTDATAVSQPSILIARGESGIALFRRRRPTQTTFYEAHRISFPFADKWNKSRFPLLRRWLTRWRERRAVRNVDGYLFLNAAVRDDHQRFFGRSTPSILLPGGVDIPAQLPQTTRDVDIIYVGKLLRRKGVHTLLDALPLLPEYNSMIVGAQSAELPITPAPNRSWLGYLPPHAIPAQWQRAKVGVCPLPLGESPISERYTFPLKVLEMMAHGVAIVGSDLPTLRVTLQHEKNALLVPPNDSPALAAAIQRLLTDAPLRRRLTAAAFETVQAYRWENRARKLHDFVAGLHE